MKTLLSAGRLTPGAIALSVIVEIEEHSVMHREAVVGKIWRPVR